MKRKSSPAALAPPAAAAQSGRPPLTISYRGYRSREGKYVVEKDCKPLRYQGDNSGPSMDIGPWEWGRRCPWAELLTWSLLMDVLDDQERAAEIAQQFADQFVFRFHVRGWMMSAQNILAAVERIEREAHSKPRNPK